MNSEFQSLPPETQEAVKRTMDTMEPAQTPGRNPGNIRGDAERRREEQHPKLPDGVPA